MMDEKEIRQRFAQLRESDRERAPSFAHTYARAQSRGSWRLDQRVSDGKLFELFGFGSLKRLLPK